MAHPRSSPLPMPKHDEINLTSEDNAALDAAWETVTDADIAASIRWLDDLPQPKKPPKENQSNG